MSVRDDLVGYWRTDPDDRWSLREYGDVSLFFDSRDGLVYTLHLKNRKQIMQMKYRVDGNFLITDQPSAPREEKTEFFFTPDGRLALKNSPPAPATFYVRTTHDSATRDH
jgi:hypothetical protein